MFFPLLILVSLLHATPRAERAVNWFQINCPGATADAPCTYTNNNPVDIAVTLFFQTEDQTGSWFQVVDSNSPAPIKPTAPQCPPGMTYSTSNNGQEKKCLITGITFPTNGLQEYCDYLSQGYEGFTYPDAQNPGYKCPPNLAPGKNDQGTDFCVYNIPSNYTLPPKAKPYCSQQAFANHELGFVWGKSTPAPTHAYDNKTFVYCSRTWTSPQLGSAGDCFFILPAGAGFRVTGKGTTNVIDAYGVKLNGKVVSANSKPISCPGNGAMTCSYTNMAGVDMYVSVSFHSGVQAMNSLNCSYGSGSEMIKVCDFASENAASSSSSCNFILPASTKMQCQMTQGLMIDSASARMMTKSLVLPSSPPIRSGVCPPAAYPKSTMCDCYYENSDMSNDVLVVMQAVNADNQYNSFHCYVWGVNVCAWGANNNNLRDAGTCYFVLPAGAAYNCSMEWGSTGFSYTTILKLNGTIYNPPTSTKPSSKPPRARGNLLPQSRPTSELLTWFTKWKQKFGKQYATPTEDARRFANFRQFVTLSDNQNFGGDTSFDRLNEMADLSRDEFEKFYRGCAYPLDKDGRVHVRKDFDFDLMDSLPASVDWRTSGAIVPVKNQGQCGSCWSFSTTGVLSSTWYLKGNRPLVSLSEQTLVSCEKDCDGCNGGWPYRAIEWVSKNGIDTEASYPYTSGNGQDGTCAMMQHQRANINVTGYTMLQNSEKVMAAYVAQYGPISISLDAMTQLWWPYQGGVMTGCCNKSPDHAVLIVGYGTVNGSDYWLIKNSWGTSWGINGYLYLERGTDQCGITVAPVVPIVG